MEAIPFWAEVLYELQSEEVEGVRQEVSEVKNEENGEINVEGEPHTSWAHVDEITSEHNSWLEPCGAVCNVTIRSDRQKTMHSRVRVDVLCVEDSHGCHVVIGVGRVIVQRHHANITYQYWILTDFLSIQLCTCSQIVCCDRQFFPVAIYCIVLHRENGWFEVWYFNIM